jgi:hypothetical protein
LRISLMFKFQEKYIIYETWTIFNSTATGIKYRIEVRILIIGRGFKNLNSINTISLRVKHIFLLIYLYFHLICWITIIINFMYKCLMKMIKKKRYWWKFCKVFVQAFLFVSCIGIMPTMVASRTGVCRRI